MAMQLSSEPDEPRPALAEVSDYNASQMTVLEGLEPVRKRPGMYIGSTGINGLHHLVWEVVDNSVDEAMAGYCSQIEVTLLADGGCRVTDDGRGIPTDLNPQLGLTGVEIALTKLHGGGKFGGSGYKVSGGLHGVGVSVVNALSSRLEVDVDRDGSRYHLAFRNGGRPEGKLDITGPAPDGRRGTTVAFWPDAKVFEETDFEARTILDRFQVYAFLNAGLEIRFVDERPGGDSRTFRFDGGIIDYVHHLNVSKDALFKKVGYYNAAGEEGESRSPSSGIPATTRTGCTATPTASPPSRAACTSRASARRSLRWSTSTPRPRT